MSWLIGYRKTILLVLMLSLTTYLIVKNFCGNTQENYKQIIFFSSQHCGHCHKFQPVWNQFVHDYGKKTSNVQLIQLDTNDANSMHLMTKYHIQAFPTILAVENGERKMEFNGARTYPNLVHFLMSF